MKLGLLISGELGFKTFEILFSQYKVSFIMTDKGSKNIIERVQELGVPLFIGNPRGGKATHFIRDRDIDLLISVNYLFIIENDLIALPKRIAFNIHGSLLPKYRGRTPHVWAIINGEKETGITAHLMDSKCDNGDIIDQIKIDIGEDTTGAEILEKFAKEYPPLIGKVLLQIENDLIQYKEQDISKVTYFGKRTPDDGQINWDWQKERIKNWVRAQAFPYPGAFSFYNNQKIIIDEIVFSDFGYSYDVPNGTIVKLKANPYVKTPNGVIEITKIRNVNNLIFKINTKLENNYEN